MLRLFHVHERTDRSIDATDAASTTTPWWGRMGDEVDEEDDIHDKRHTKKKNTVKRNIPSKTRTTIKKRTNANETLNRRRAGRRKSVPNVKKRSTNANQTKQQCTQQQSRSRKEEQRIHRHNEIQNIDSLVGSFAENDCSDNDDEIFFNAANDDCTVDKKSSSRDHRISESRNDDIRTHTSPTMQIDTLALLLQSPNDVDRTVRAISTSKRSKLQSISKRLVTKKEIKKKCPIVRKRNASIDSKSVTNSNASEIANHSHRKAKAHIPLIGRSESTAQLPFHSSLTGQYNNTNVERRNRSTSTVNDSMVEVNNVDKENISNVVDTLGIFSMSILPKNRNTALHDEKERKNRGYLRKARNKTFVSDETLQTTNDKRALDPKYQPQEPNRVSTSERDLFMKSRDDDNKHLNNVPVSSSLGEEGGKRAHCKSKDLVKQVTKTSLLQIDQEKSVQEVESPNALRSTKRIGEKKETTRKNLVTTKNLRRSTRVCAIVSKKAIPSQHSMRPNDNTLYKKPKKRKNSRSQQDDHETSFVLVYQNDRSKDKSKRWIANIDDKDNNDQDLLPTSDQRNECAEAYDFSNEPLPVLKLQQQTPNSSCDVERRKSLRSIVAKEIMTIGQSSSSQDTVRQNGQIGEPMASSIIGSHDHSIGQRNELMDAQPNGNNQARDSTIALNCQIHSKPKKNCPDIQSNPLHQLPKSNHSSLIEVVEAAKNNVNIDGHANWNTKGHDSIMHGKHEHISGGRDECFEYIPGDGYLQEQMEHASSPRREDCRSNSLIQNIVTQREPLVCRLLDNENCGKECGIVNRKKVVNMHTNIATNMHHTSNDNDAIVSKVDERHSSDQEHVIIGVPLQIRTSTPAAVSPLTTVELDHCIKSESTSLDGIEKNKNSIGSIQSHGLCPSQICVLTDCDLSTLTPCTPRICERKVVVADMIPETLTTSKNQGWRNLEDRVTCNGIASPEKRIGSQNEECWSREAHQSFEVRCVEHPNDLPRNRISSRRDVILQVPSVDRIDRNVEHKALHNNCDRSVIDTTVDYIAANVGVPTSRKSWTRARQGNVLDLNTENKSHCYDGPASAMDPDDDHNDDITLEPKIDKTIPAVGAHDENGRILADQARNNEGFVSHISTSSICAFDGDEPVSQLNVAAPDASAHGHCKLPLSQGNIQRRDEVFFDQQVLHSETVNTSMGRSRPSFLLEQESDYARLLKAELFSPELSNDLSWDRGEHADVADAVHDGNHVIDTTQSALLERMNDTEVGTMVKSDSIDGPITAMTDITNTDQLEIGQLETKTVNSVHEGPIMPINSFLVDSTTFNPIYKRKRSKRMQTRIGCNENATITKANHTSLSKTTGSSRHSNKLITKQQKSTQADSPVVPKLRRHRVKTTRYGFTKDADLSNLNVIDNDLTENDTNKKSECHNEPNHLPITDCPVSKVLEISDSQQIAYFRLGLSIEASHIHYMSANDAFETIPGMSEIQPTQIIDSSIPGAGLKTGFENPSRLRMPISQHFVDFECHNDVNHPRKGPEQKMREVSMLDDQCEQNIHLTSQSKNRGFKENFSNNDWSDHQLIQLRKARGKVNPTSSSFWTDVAAEVEGKSSSECRDRWYALVKTPKDSKRQKRGKCKSKAFENEEDDIFNATPMRDIGVSDQALFHCDGLSPIHVVADSGSLLRRRKRNSMSSCEVDETPALTYKPKAGYKSYVQGLKRHCTKANNMKKKPKKGKEKTRTVRAVTETYRDRDVDMHARLSPGGRLEVKDRTEADDVDDFWNELYEDEDES